jgi:hypothetical protein
LLRNLSFVKSHCSNREMSKSTGASAPSAVAASTAPAPGVPSVAMERIGNVSSSLMSQWKVILPFVIGIGVLGGNIGLLAKLAGSSDAWDTIKTQMGGSIAMSFIGATFLTIALWVYFSSYNVGVPIYILVALVNIGIAVGLSAMSVAAMTR